jgi:hypothetical protein
MWYCATGKWNEDIAPYLGWVIIGTIISTIIICLISIDKIEQKNSNVIVYKEIEKGGANSLSIIAREVYTWKTVERTREIYK